MNGNILANRSAKDRNQVDFYETPPLATVALIDFLEANGSLHPGVKVWEPACGAGKLAEVLKRRDYEVICTDLNDFGYGESGVDFLESQRDCDWIITNPPFSKAAEFIRHARDLNANCAFLLKSQFWHAKSRINMFRNDAPSYVLPLTWRPDFLYGQKSGSPTMEVIWSAWDGTVGTYYRPLEKPSEEQWIK